MAAKMTYEQAMARLEEIVTKLASFCNTSLEKAKLKITELSEKQEG